MDDARRRLLVVLATAPVAALAGCPGDGDSGTDDGGIAEDAGTGDNGSGGDSDQPGASLPLEQGAKLVPEDGGEGDFFGQSVAVSGDGGTAVVGARGEEGPNGKFAGSAYVFSHTDGGWHQQAKLALDDGGLFDEFGTSVAVSGGGNTAIIGAPGDEDPNGSHTGSAHVFSREGVGWQQEAKLVPDDGDEGDSFGRQAAMSGDGGTAVVEASSDNDQSVYVFSKTGGAWQQQATLAPDDGDDSTIMGRVAVSGDGSTVIAGAISVDGPDGEATGSADVFSLADGVWQRQATLAAADGGRLGRSVATVADGSTAIVGGLGDDDPDSDVADTGSAYVFSQVGDSWQQEATLAPDGGGDGDSFVSSVAVSGDGSAAVVGVRGDGDPNSEAAGSASVFSQAGDSWQQVSTLSPDDCGGCDAFGHSVVVSGDGSTAVVGAYDDEDPNGWLAGSAYVFE
jgi:hypothetical protein